MSEPHTTPPPLPPCLPPLPPRLPPIEFTTTTSQIVCMLLIGLCVGLMVVENLMEKPAPSAKQKPGPNSQQITEGRAAAGLTALMARFAPQDLARTGSEQARALRVRAISTTDRFYAAIVIAAIDSKFDAQQMLQDVAKDARDDSLAEDAAALRDHFGGAPLADDVARRLVDRHGWFGELAVVAKEPAGSALRRPAENTAIRSFAALMGFGLGVFLAIAIGIGLGTTAIVFLVMGKLRFAVPQDRGRDAMLEAFTVYLAGMTVGACWSMFNLPAEKYAAISITLASCVLAAVWPLLRGMSLQETKLAYGLHRGRGVFREIGSGIVGYVALLPLIALATVIMLLISTLSGTKPSHPISEMLTGPLWSYLLVAALAIVYAPVTEELFFRGAFFGHLRARMHWLVAAIVVGIIFAAIHPQGWVGIPLLTTIGVNLAIIRQWRGSLIAAITGHALNNGTLIVMSGLALR